MLYDVDNQPILAGKCLDGDDCPWRQPSLMRKCLDGVDDVFYTQPYCEEKMLR